MKQKTNFLYKKALDGKETYNNPTPYLLEYLSSQGVMIPKNTFINEDVVIKEIPVIDLN